MVLLLDAELMEKASLLFSIFLEALKELGMISKIVEKWCLHSRM